MPQIPIVVTQLIMTTDDKNDGKHSPLDVTIVKPAFHKYLTLYVATPSPKRNNARKSHIGDLTTFL